MTSPLGMQLLRALMAEFDNVARAELQIRLVLALEDQDLVVRHMGNLAEVFLGNLVRAPLVATAIDGQPEHPIAAKSPEHFLAGLPQVNALIEADGLAAMLKDLNEHVLIEQA